jgi:hypothetical protein
MKSGLAGPKRRASGPRGWKSSCAVEKQQSQNGRPCFEPPRRAVRFKNQPVPLKKHALLQRHVPLKKLPVFFEPVAIPPLGLGRHHRSVERMFLIRWRGTW